MERDHALHSRAAAANIENSLGFTVDSAGHPRRSDRSDPTGRLDGMALGGRTLRDRDYRRAEFPSIAALRDWLDTLNRTYWLTEKDTTYPQE